MVMNIPVGTPRLAVRREASAWRRRRRLLSASENGAIVEYDPVTSYSVSAAAGPSQRISLPPRYVLTRPQLFDYYKLVTGREPALMRRCATEEGYSYSWFTPAVIEGKAKTAKGRRRLQEALFTARASSLGNYEGEVKGVFDSGHIYSPIYRQAVIKSQGVNATNTDNVITDQPVENSDDMDRNVIFVHPLIGEVATEEKVVSDELRRVAPKGREWDRQHALRHSLGQTVQEAIIDNRIDSRYRLPGDYVRRNGRGEFVDARGNPMRMIRASRREVLETR